MKTHQNAIKTALIKLIRWMVILNVTLVTTETIRQMAIFFIKWINCKAVTLPNEVNLLLKWFPLAMFSSEIVV